MPTLSPLAQENRAKLENFLDFVEEGIKALRADLADEANNEDSALTGQEFINLNTMLMKVCQTWHIRVEKIIEETPEYQAWACDLKPGLND